MSDLGKGPGRAGIEGQATCLQPDVNDSGNITGTGSVETDLGRAICRRVARKHIQTVASDGGQTLSRAEANPLCLRYGSERNDSPIVPEAVAIVEINRAWLDQGITGSVEIDRRGATHRAVPTRHEDRATPSGILIAGKQIDVAAGHHDEVIVVIKEQVWATVGVVDIVQIGHDDVARPDVSVDHRVEPFKGTVGCGIRAVNHILIPVATEVGGCREIQSTAGVGTVMEVGVSTNSIADVRIAVDEILDASLTSATGGSAVEIPDYPDAVAMANHDVCLRSRSACHRKISSVVCDDEKISRHCPACRNAPVSDLGILTGRSGISAPQSDSARTGRHDDFSTESRGRTTCQSPAVSDLDIGIFTGLRVRIEDHPGFDMDADIPGEIATGIVSTVADLGIGLCPGTADEFEGIHPHRDLVSRESVISCFFMSTVADLRVVRGVRSGVARGRVCPRPHLQKTASKHGDVAARVAGGRLGAAVPDLHIDIVAAGLSSRENDVAPCRHGDVRRFGTTGVGEASIADLDECVADGTASQKNIASRFDVDGFIDRAVNPVGESAAVPDHDHRLTPAATEERHIRPRPESPEGDVSIGVTGSRYSAMSDLGVGIPAACGSLESDATVESSDLDVATLCSDAQFASIPDLRKSIDPKSPRDRDISPV